MKRVSLFLMVVFLVGVLPLLVSCDKQAALEQIYKDPVLRQSILDRVAADTEMITSMVDRALTVVERESREKAEIDAGSTLGRVIELERWEQQRGDTPDTKE